MPGIEELVCRMRANPRTLGSATRYASLATISDRLACAVRTTSSACPGEAARW